LQPVRLAPVLWLLAPGCATPGDEPWAGWATYGTTLGGYEYRYLSPPFEDVGDVPEGESHIQIDSAHDDEVPAGLPRLPPSFEIWTAPRPAGDTLACAHAAVSSIPSDLAASSWAPECPDGETECPPAPPADEETRSGLVGHQVYLRDRYLRHYRYLCLALPAGNVEVRIDMNEEPVTRDLQDLIDSFAAIP
jgi:hypothetical protein